MNNSGAIHSNKISGLKWIATGLQGLIPCHSQKEFCAHLKWISVAHVELDDKFDFINDIV